MKISSLLLMCLLVFKAWGGEGFSKGNGGYGIYCAQNENWMTLDSFESTMLYNLELDSYLLENAEFLSKVSSRLERVNPLLASDFREFTNTWNRDLVWIETMDLGPINDVFPSVLPLGCELKLAGFQRAQRYFLSRPIWNALGSKEQKILMVHELFYRTLLKRKKMNDSRPVRALVALVLSESFEQMSDQEIQKFISSNVL